ncbi:unnamed protein product [Dovyalis caffra]|uniref:Uncharacterized protein n=1 Tax=Dovyalis caffra TaxID=77055 RepID=A0AAV1RI01_9ROSI|nr:unnamed protein product [Dovyalis caffra]
MLFSEVAELRYVFWLEITARIETKILSPKTTYAAYFVFKFTDSKRGFNKKPVELSVKFEGSVDGEKRNVLLDVSPENDMPQLPQERGDGWMEVEMGEFFNENGDDGMVVSSLREVDNYITKHGLIVEGIEFRPKAGVHFEIMRRELKTYSLDSVNDVAFHSSLFILILPYDSKRPSTMGSQ